MLPAQPQQQEPEYLIFAVCCPLTDSAGTNHIRFLWWATENMPRVGSYPRLLKTHKIHQAFNLLMLGLNFPKGLFQAERFYHEPTTLRHIKTHQTTLEKRGKRHKSSRAATLGSTFRLSGAVPAHGTRRARPGYLGLPQRLERPKRLLPNAPQRNGPGGGTSTPASLAARPATRPQHRRVRTAAATGPPRAKSTQGWL